MYHRFLTYPGVVLTDASGRASYGLPILLVGGHAVYASDVVEITQGPLAGRVVYGRDVALDEAQATDTPESVRQALAVYAALGGRDGVLKPGRRIPGKAIWLLRQQLGLSQAALAAALLTTPSTIGAWERGRRHPSSRMIARLRAIEGALAAKQKKDAETPDCA